MADHDISFGYQPGQEIGYTQITSAVNITGTALGAETTVITSSAILFDGAPVIATVYCPAILCDTASAGDLFNILLYEGSTAIGFLGQIRSALTSAQNILALTASYRFNPTAGLHTYSVKCYVTSTTGTPAFSAGAGGGSVYMPAYLRFTKV